MSNEVGRLSGPVLAGAMRESAAPEVLEALQLQLAKVTDDRPFREQRSSGAFRQLPEAVQRHFYGDRFFQGEDIGLGRVASQGSHVFLNPYWGNLGAEAAHVVGVAQTPDGRFVPLKGVIAQTWFGRTAGLKLEVAGRSFGADEAGLLVATLRTLQQELFKSKPVAPR